MEHKNQEIKYKINEATLEDITNIVQLWKEAIDLHASMDKSFILLENGEEKYASFLREAIFSEKQVILKAENEDRELLGFIFGYISEKSMFFKRKITAHISDIVVHKNHRKKGIGTRLMERFEKGFAKKFNASSITLYVHPLNEIALKFYDKLKFREQLRLLIKEI
ncbi:MAG: GNAT family N-acetyltransferase [Candidatus Heimdallarchaeum endolithica]|uniref:GNAT family N-acetyltransferase n=1 Tax=Candidatus Heimdallarchaeum endolithica TaxID=2876572 RepID=A0A9Y1BTK8_9ARCH|nr:MAG: GNAT family N-acetyltransferase [Candidatus Heimdallarchaeum endolithica]